MWWQYIVLVGLLGLASGLVVLLARTVRRLYITLQGPFFAETSYERINHIKEIGQVADGMRIADLGSGDGRILIELAKEFDIEAVGYEINPRLVKLSQKNIADAGVEDKVVIKQESFWNADVSDFDIITVYGVQRFMNKLGRKLQQEIGDKTRVLSVFFYFPNWKQEDRLGDIRLYRK